MTARPLVSVLIPCYNAAAYVAEATGSARAQTYRPIEIICVDDGSRDDSAAVLERLAGPDLRVIRQDNAGQSAALNRALAESRGEFIQFLDADDVLDPDKIASQMPRLLAQPGAVGVSAWGRFRERVEETAFIPEPCWRDAAPLAWLALSWHIGGGMMFPARWLLPRAVLDKAGGWDESLTVHNDGEYFTRVVMAASRVLFEPRARAHYRSNVAGSVSSQRHARGLESYFRSIEAIENTLRPRLDDESLRQGLSLMWQRYAYGTYPFLPASANEAMRRARLLHSATLPLEGGWRFVTLARLIGWRWARRLQVWSGRP